MFNYVTVEFPNTTVAPQYVYSMSFYQNKYEHEVAVIKFRDWGVSYDAVRNGSPITFTLSNKVNSRTFYGYVHHINVTRTSGMSTTEVVAISASYVMKNQYQTVYKGLTADAIVQKIAKKNNFVCFSVPHPRVYPQVAQAGHSDWEMCVRLAKQAGYSLRTENTELYFQPMLYDYTNKRSEAAVFTMREANDPSGSSIYSFEPVVSESMDYEGDMKAAVSISGVDKSTVSSMSITQQLRAKNTRTKTSPEFFDKYATEVVATDPSIAQYEAEAAENRNLFPYRGTAEVLGNPSLRPDMPVYLEGIGADYTGYWTILGTEHRIQETERNTQTYITVLTVGADSLGSATTWTDGQQITSPNTKPSRTVIPNIRQTNEPPKTRLVKASLNLGPQSPGYFGVASNRAKPTTNGQLINGPVWVTATQTLDPYTQTTSSTTQTPNRILGRIATAP